MIYTVTLNPAVDKSASVDEICLNQVNRLKKVTSDAGGKGINVSRTLKCLRTPSVATGFLGGSGGNFIECLLMREEIDSHMVHIIGNTRTNLKIFNKDSVMTELNEEGPFILQNEADALMDYLRGNLDSSSILVISGSMPKGLARSTYSTMIEMTKENGGRVILDSTFPLMKDALEARPTIMKPNAVELAQFFGRDDELSEDEIIHYGKELLNNGIGMLIVTRDIRGIYVFTHDNVFKCEPIPVEIKSRVGAGDAFVAGFAHGLNESMEFEDILKLASGCFHASMMSKNARPVSLQSIKEFESKAVITVIE